MEVHKPRFSCLPFQTSVSSALVCPGPTVDELCGAKSLPPPSSTGRGRPTTLADTQTNAAPVEWFVWSGGHGPIVESPEQNLRHLSPRQAKGHPVAIADCLFVSLLNV